MVKTKENNIRKIKVGIIGRQILFLLGSGINFWFTYSVRRKKWILKQIPKELSKIKKKELNRAIQKLYQSKLVDIKEHPNGETTLVLTEQGKLRYLTYNIDNIKLPKNQKWDKQWRFVIFDIPEKHKMARKAFASKLKEIGLYPLQKSVYVYPFEFKDEIDFLIEYFNLRPYVRFGKISEIDNEIHLRKIFRLI